MAIVVDKGLPGAIDQGRTVFYAYANRIIKFHSDTLTPAYATVSGYKIYPSPSGTFEFNLKNLLIFNLKTSTHNLKDSDNIQLGYVGSFFFGTTGITSIYIKIYDDSGTVETDNSIRYVWYMAKTVNAGEPDSMYMQDKTFISYAGNYLTIWNGYPFDFVNAGNGVKLHRGIDGAEVYTAPVLPQRLFLSNGEIFDDLLKENDLILVKDDTGNVIDSIQLDVRDCLESVYIKWLSPAGTFKYWLFSDKKTVTTKVKDRGYWLNDFADDSTNMNKYNSLGKEGGKKITKLYAVGLNGKQRLYLSDIVESPRVYIYLGKKGELATPEKFKQIKILDNSFVSENLGKNEHKISLSIEELNSTMY